MCLFIDKNSLIYFTGILEATHHLRDILANLTINDLSRTMRIAESVLLETKVDENASISMNHLVAFLFKPKHTFAGLEIIANDKKAMPDKSLNNSIVNVHLPRELDAGPNNTIVFCMLTWKEPDGTMWNQTDVLYERRLVGLSVGGKVISGLKERVNITMNLTTVIHKKQEPRCVFYNFSTEAFSSDGCLTLWKRDQRYITCSCNHLTYFGVLMVTPSNLSPEDTLILKYITLIGCSLSLVGLIINLLLFITNRKLRTDVSMRVHFSLAIALILLNVHFLISQQTAALSSTGFCFYIAIALHYSLLASFSWMALEGFHLYILLVRVFNIYIRRYLLKLSLVGWGVPAVIVSLVVIIDKDAYGHAPLNPSNPNDTTICYITNNTVKDVTTIGAFGLVFIFNMIMLVVTIRQVLSLRHDKEFGQSNYGRVKGDILVLLGISILLGITWGLVFFSFGSLTTPGLYLFCILNSLQGFFIFLWFVLALRKTRKSPTTSSETRSTS
ncbi:adhesion G-protein coupled receptor G2-like [Channa argus]|uniref:adhesion G-protein coupled receptor G2-like n=1 Tax=Channa argus TaxID=215402 RepID=UPI003520330E